MCIDIVETWFEITNGQILTALPASDMIMAVAGYYSFMFLLLYFLEKIRFNISCELSARQNLEVDSHEMLSFVITKTCLFKYTEKLITEKLKIFRQKIQIFFIFLLKT